MRHILSGLALGASCALTSVLAAQEPSFTLEQVMSAPFPADLVSARGGTGRAAWTSLEKGRRSVWLADFRSARAIRVANWPKDDGQDLGQVALSRDGAIVAFVRGEGYNRQRHNPNPSSDPHGAEQAVWVSANAQPMHRIGVGASPIVSPDGGRVVFQRDSTLMVAPTAGAAIPRPLFVARGVNGEAAWSPDGRMVAFTSARGDHSYVGVYDVARDSLRWMAPGVDRDASPRWSPDGKKIAFVRTAGGAGGGNVFSPAAGTGFGIWVADPVTGAGKMLWHSQPGIAGRLRRPTAGEYFFYAGSQIVFVTEADGWQHFYAIPADGSASAPVQLTSGECEDEQPSVSADGAWVYYASNCKDIDRKHIWRVQASGGKAPEQITSGSSIEWAPAVSGGSRMMFLHSDARMPASPALASLDGKTVALAGAPALPKDFPIAALVEPQQVIFKAADGTDIHGQLFASKSSSKTPGLVFIHGGSMREMLLGWSPLFYYHNAYGMNQYLVSKGYTVLSVNYRSGIGYGRAFREMDKVGRRGGSEVQDVIAAGRHLASLPGVDSARIGLWGGSYGGYLTAYGMEKAPELFKAGVDLHGVHDWNADFSDFAPATVARGQREADSVIATGVASSPVCCVSNIRGPLLLIQGDDDRNVSFSQTVTFAQMLRKEKKPFELLVFPDEVHDFLRFQNWWKAYVATTDFFNRTLMKGESIAIQ